MSESGVESPTEVPQTPASMGGDSILDDVVDQYHEDNEHESVHTPAAVSSPAPPREDLDERLTQEVSYLSTQLMTVMGRQVELEEVIQHLKRDNGQLKAQVQTLTVDSQNYALLVPQHEQLQQEFTTHKTDKETEFVALQAEVAESNRLKDAAEDEVNKLRAEVEELTASLFDEANKMVSESNREVNNFKIKNGKLYEELDEKDTIIEGLQAQLNALKDLFAQLEEKEKLHSSRNGTPQVEQGEFITGGESKSINGGGSEENFQDQQLKSVIFSPNVNSIRFDLNNYQKEFKQFIYALINPDFVFDLANLRNLKYFKKIWIEELEPSISYVPNLSVSSLINRWNKNKHFWNAIVEGRAIIEPVNGINEVFKLAYRGKANGEKPKGPPPIPVAIKEGCGLCGESRKDILEHSRLYYFKLLVDQPVGSTTPNDEIIGSYPLCNYCLIKLRNLCEFFAKLRAIHQNVYQLKPNKSFEEFNYATTNSHNVTDSTTTPSTTASSPATFSGPFKRSNSYSSSIPTATDSESNLMNSNVSAVHVGRDEEAKLIKIYFMLILIRNKLFWSKIGFWDNSDNIKEINLEDVRYATFKSLVGHIPENAIEKPDTPPPVEIVAVEDEDDNEKKVVVDQTKLKVAETEEEDSDDGAFADSSQHFEGKVSLENGGEEKKSEVDGDEEEKDQPEQEEGGEDDGEEGELDEGKVDLTRKPSKSKQFSQKLNNDLDETLEMLKESIEQ
ncbi:hypothetical protein DFJ63DRAFT_311220 [Scheffersomyces coipomensis]|uniref:uncharacterized protein n=1 Tax=Scheffersomyces coipomensis TaxID=1788519 RepID=UPI00315D2BB1